MGTFSDLLVRAKTGDHTALEEVHERYRARVMGVVRRGLKPALRRRYDTADLAQSVFMEVLRDLPRFEDRGEQAFIHWLYVKAEMKVAEKFRKVLRPSGGRREDTLTDDSADAIELGRGGASSSFGGDDDAAAQARALTLLESLDPDQRDIVALRDREGLTFKEIAARLGLASEDAARMRHARALLALRRKWKSASN